MHKLNSLSISGVLIFIVTVPLICSSYALRQNDKLRGISVIASLPVVIVSDSLRAFNITDTISIYSFHEFELYQLPRTRKFETEEEIAGTETYFIYKKGAENGFWFESLTNMDAWKKLPVDSFLRSRANRGLDFTINEKYLLLDVTKKTNGDLLRKYIYTGDHDENTPDSFFYYFTNQNIDFDYSFSKKWTV